MFRIFVHARVAKGQKVQAQCINDDTLGDCIVGTSYVPAMHLGLSALGLGWVGGFQQGSGVLALGPGTIWARVYAATRISEGPGRMTEYIADRRKELLYNHNNNRLQDNEELYI